MSKSLIYLLAFSLVLGMAGNWQPTCQADWPDNVGLLFGAQGIEPGDPSQGEAPPGKTNWYVDADAPDGGDGSYANPYNSFEQVVGSNASGYVTGQIRGGDYLYVKGTFSASNHVEGSNNMDIHIGRAIQAGTAAEPTVIKSWLGSPRAVFDGENSKTDLIQIRALSGGGHFIIQNIEAKRGRDRAIGIKDNIASCEIVSVVVHDTLDIGITGEGGGILFCLRAGQPHFILRNSLIYNNGMYPSGIRLLSEPTVQTGAYINIYENEFYNEDVAIRHKHSGNMICRVYNNIIHDSDMAISVRGYNGNYIHHNIMYNLDLAVEHYQASQQADSYTEFYNNTLYNVVKIWQLGLGQTPNNYRRDFNVHDNIYYNDVEASDWVIELGRYSGDEYPIEQWESSYNTWYYLASRTTFLFAVPNSYTFSEAGVYLDDSTMFTFDPQFVDGPNHDFHLQPTSPAIGAGSTGGDLGALGTGAPQPPGQASNPSPANSTTDVSVTDDLSWTAGSGSTSSDVYFGTDPTPDSGEFQGNQTATTFDPGTMANNTTYYWRIDEINGEGTTTGTVWNFTTEGVPSPPGQATNPSPADSATDVSTTADLSWTAGTGATSRDVYFGTSSPGAFQGNQTATTYDTGTMANDTTYYWRIDAVNAQGTTTGSVWSFTTAAASSQLVITNLWVANSKPYEVVDGGLEVGALQCIDRSYTFSVVPASYVGETYIKTAMDDKQLTGDNFLSFDTNQDVAVYVAHDDRITTKPTWLQSFTDTGDNLTAGGMAHSLYHKEYSQGTVMLGANGGQSSSTAMYNVVIVGLGSPGNPPGQATSPSPADSATGVSITADLSWSAGTDATSHDVYFGTSSPGASQGNQAATTFDTGVMTNDTTYYWRIDEINAGGTTTGSVWSFTTIVAAPSQATNPSPADSAANASITADLSWTAGSGATSHDVYFGTSSPGSFQGNQTVTTFDTGTMSNDTTYYWRIDQVNAGGTTTGSVWSFTTGSQPSVDPNLVGWWELENNANDSVGTNDGTIYGAVGTSGKFGQALSFDEIDDYVDVPDFDYTNTSNEFSLSFWFRIDDVAGSLYQYMFSHGNYAAANSLNVYFSETDEGTGGEEVRTNITLSDSTSWQPSTASIFADGQWHMYTITVSSVDGATIYIDANSVLTNTAIKGAALNPATAIHIGARCDLNADRYFGNPSIDDGILDDVRLYNRVLNQTDVDDIYAGGPAPPSQATNPAPADTATDVSIEDDLSWTAGTGATSHDVYFGTTGPGDFQGNQTETTFEPGSLSYDITYYWRIDEINTACTTTGAVWSFTTEAAPQPPGQASNPDPADSATNVSINADLSWTAGSGSTSSDVYFGTTSPGTFQGNQTETTFDPGTMANDTTYYWRIDEINEVGTTAGTVWNFTTIVAPPGQASNPDPADSATNVDIDADLSWTAGSGSTSSDVYFGTTSPGSFQGNQTATTFEPGTMAYDTTYYWRIDEINVAGTTTGNVWSFTTIVAPPGQASSPSPADSAIDVAVSADLSWTAGSAATSSDVYFGTTSPGTFQGNQAATTFDPGTMANDTTYYWRIDEVNAGGTTTGSVWSFTTEAAAGPVTKEFGDATNTDYPGTIEDTYMNAGDPDGNRSTVTQLKTYTWPTDTIANATIIKWDLSAIPTDATVIEATLYLYLVEAGGDSTYDMGVHKIINVNPVISALTWNTYDGTNSWTGGGNGGQSDIATAEDIPAVNNTLNEYKTWSVINMVADWVSAPSDNYGMMVNADAGATIDSHRLFASTEDSDSSVRPKLIVTYSVGVAPPGQASSPSPVDSATDVDIDADLSWTAGTDSTSSDVYFGTSSPGTFQGNQTATTFDPGTLANDTTYYWRIDEVNANGTTTGNVWSFTTEAAAETIKINFQPAAAQVPTGYEVDSGEAYGDRGNGLTYGWDVKNTQTRDRNADPDQRYDTLNHLQKKDDLTWEIELSNGTYDVWLVCGDPSFTDQVNTMDVEGTVCTDPDGQDNFDEYNIQVNVTDGRLTITPAAGSSNSKICFVEITN